MIDTQFFLRGMDPASLEGEKYITEAVREEVSRGFPGRKMEYFLDSGAVKVADPPKEYLERVRKEAVNTGDIGRLSEADISVLALALHLGAAIISDDYSVQNLSSRMSIECHPLSEKGIKEEWRWGYRCTGCRRIFNEPHDVCPVCGAPLKPVRLSHSR